jgi:hypothetical protein
MPFTRVLTKSLKYAMDMATCGAKWITVEDYGGHGPLHVYLSIYNLVVIY